MISFYIHEGMWILLEMLVWSHNILDLFVVLKGECFQNLGGRSLIEDPSDGCAELETDFVFGLLIVVFLDSD